MPTSPRSPPEVDTSRGGSVITHPYLVTGLLPIGIRSMDFRLNPARLFGDRKGGSMEKRFKSDIVVHTRRDMPARPSELHPRKTSRILPTNSAVELTRI